MKSLEKLEKRKYLAIASIIFVASLLSGFYLGELGANKEGKFQSEVDFEANSSDTIKTFEFDGKEAKLIIQPGNKSKFFMEINGTVNEIRGTFNDGEVHQVSDVHTIGEKMYIFRMRYIDNPGSGEEDWIRIYSIMEL